MTDQNFRATPRPAYDKASFIDKRRFSNQISITSAAGVGGTTLFKMLKAEFDQYAYRFVSGGALMRMRAAQNNMTIEQFAEHNRLHPEDRHDAWCDGTIEAFGRQNYVVGEGRLPHVFMPYAFHVLLVCNPLTKSKRRAQDTNSDIHVVMSEMTDRDINDSTRYDKLYPGSLWKNQHFDLVIDTGVFQKPQVLENTLCTHARFLEYQQKVNLVEGIIMPSS